MHKQTDFNLPKHRGFKIAFLNIASLPKHIDELRLNMQHQYLDILVLNETHLDETISNFEISIDKYTLVRNDRTRHGGGVAMYIRNSITKRQIQNRERKIGFDLYNILKPQCQIIFIY